MWGKRHHMPPPPEMEGMAKWRTFSCLSLLQVANDVVKTITLLAGENVHALFGDT